MTQNMTYFGVGYKLADSEKEKPSQNTFIQGQTPEEAYAKLQGLGLQKLRNAGKEVEIYDIYICKRKAST